MVCDLDYIYCVMKDTGKRILSAILALWWLGTLWLYIYQWLPVVKEYMMQYNYTIIGALWVLFVFFFLQFSLLILPGKWLKIKAVVIGLLVVLMWYYFINNNASKWIYAGDIISLLWVLMIYLSLGWMIVTKQAEKKISEGKQVIIEV
jgi:hypothetical protein